MRVIHHEFTGILRKNWLFSDVFDDGRDIWVGGKNSEPRPEIEDICRMTKGVFSPRGKHRYPRGSVEKFVALMVLLVGGSMHAAFVKGTRYRDWMEGTEESV